MPQVGDVYDVYDGGMTYMATVLLRERTNSAGGMATTVLYPEGNVIEYVEYLPIEINKYKGWVKKED